LSRTLAESILKNGNTAEKALANKADNWRGVEWSWYTKGKRHLYVVSLIIIGK
jgi:hypothetical protein